MTRRFTTKQVINRHGRDVVQVADATLGIDLWVHRVGEGLYYWNKKDRRVENRHLRKLAREALNLHRQEQERAGIVRIPADPRACRRCEATFRPASRNSRATLCPACRGDVSRKNARARYAGVGA